MSEQLPSLVEIRRCIHPNIANPEVLATNIHFDGIAVYHAGHPGFSAFGLCRDALGADDLDGSRRIRWRRKRVGWDFCIRTFCGIRWEWLLSGCRRQRLRHGCIHGVGWDRG
jgi:hypothetical protein